MDEDIDRAEETKRALASISCRYCGAIITPHQAIQPGHCGAQPCFQAHLIRGVEAQDDQRARDYAERQMDAKRGKAAEMASVAAQLECDPDDLLIAAVPFQDNPIEPVSETYRLKFLQHIEDIVAEAFNLGEKAAETAKLSPNMGNEHPIIDAACGTCQGFCCARGGGEKFAFLSPKAILAYRRQNPDVLPEDVIAHYTEALPETSVRGACAYQTETGCSLERTSRATICNTFYCHDLFAMHDLTKGSSNVNMAIVGINDDTPEKVTAFSQHAGSFNIEPS